METMYNTWLQTLAECRNLPVKEPGITDNAPETLTAEIQPNRHQVAILVVYASATILGH